MDKDVCLLFSEIFLKISIECKGKLFVVELLYNRD